MQSVTEQPRIGLASGKLGPAFTSRMTRNAMLELLAETIADALYQADEVWTESTRAEPFGNLPEPLKTIYLTRARRAVLDIDGPSRSRALSRTVAWAKLANDVTNPDEWAPAVQVLAEETAVSALGNYPAELDKVWREEVGR
jgi:hypothetical protein